MKQALALVSVVVHDYDEAIQWYTETLDFQLVEYTDQPEQQKRWVVIAPPGAAGCQLLLARAKNDAERAAIGNQTGGRVFLFLHTDDFDRDFQRYQARGVTFVRPPNQEAFGKVAVFKDLYGNLWDLIQPTDHV